MTKFSFYKTKSWFKSEEREIERERERTRWKRLWTQNNLQWGEKVDDNFNSSSSLNSSFYPLSEVHMYTLLVHVIGKRFLVFKNYVIKTTWGHLT